MSVRRATPTAACLLSSWPSHGCPVVPWFLALAVLLMTIVLTIIACSRSSEGRPLAHGRATHSSPPNPDQTPLSAALFIRRSGQCPITRQTLSCRRYRQRAISAVSPPASVPETATATKRFCTKHCNLQRVRSRRPGWRSGRRVRHKLAAFGLVAPRASRQLKRWLHW